MKLKGCTLHIYIKQHRIQMNAAFSYKAQIVTM